MKKIISLFQRNYDGDRLVRDEVVPGAEWVIAGEGQATRKYDGTCCMVKDNRIFKRYDCKEGKTPPVGFIPAQDPDPITKHWPGWLECEPTNPSDKWFFEGLENLLKEYGEMIPDGTYELCGPKVNGNPEKYDKHTLIFHGIEKLLTPRKFNDLKEWFKDKDIEGIVWHHFDGRMVKIKKKDFGYGRNIKDELK
jgi:hypothetical protein